MQLARQTKSEKSKFAHFFSYLCPNYAEFHRGFLRKRENSLSALKIKKLREALHLSLCNSV